MARKKSDLPSAGGKPKSKAAAKRNSSTAAGSSFAWGHPQFRRRAMAAGLLGVIALLAWGGREAWRQAAPIVAQRPRYLVRADAITINEPPEWIAADIRGEVVHNSGLDGRLSILDPDLPAAVQNAFTLHPWVESVNRVEKRTPAGLHVDLTFRRPVAAIEAPGPDGVSQLLPVDGQGIHLPAEDVPEIRLRYLPRLTNVVGKPPAGQRWDDPRVAGGVEIAARLAPEWESLHLHEIAPSARAEIQGDHRYFVYDLVTRGGTRIVWGAAPQDHVPGEAEFGVKLDRLKQCVAQYATLDWVDWPAVVDVRRGIAITPRTVEKPDASKMVK